VAAAWVVLRQLGLLRLTSPKTKGQ
jgi:hypothetical protein